MNPVNKNQQNKNQQQANNKNAPPARQLNKKQQEQEKEKERLRELERQKEIEREKEKQREAERIAALNAEPVREYSDTLIGSSTGINYFCIWSKYYYYVYDKKCRVIKAVKYPYPIIQIEVIENKSIENYGIELEMISRAEDCRDDEEKERDHLFLEYICILDPAKLPKTLEEKPAQVVVSSAVSTDKKGNRSKSKDQKKNRNVGSAAGQTQPAPEVEETIESQIMRLYYIPSCKRIEIHSCVTLSKDKTKMFTCTDISDNIVTIYRNRPEHPMKKGGPLNYHWKYHASLDDNLERITALVLSDDEQYMLAVVSWGFKVYYLLTGNLIIHTKIT